MGLFDRSPFAWLSSSGRHATAARRAELRGELARAAELWGLAGRPEEAARIMLVRGDSEVEPARRLPHYVQALALARSLGPEGEAVLERATRKHGGLVIALAASAADKGALSVARRQELTEVGRSLEAVHAPDEAAAAYRLADDREGEARALTQAGDIDRLEALLAGEAGKDREARRQQGAYADIDLLERSGRRREALARAEALVRERPDDRLAQDRAGALRARRASGPRVRVAVGPRPTPRALRLVLGAEIVLGRTEGDVRVPSHAVSGRHLALRRAADGRPSVRDLGSRNGTQLRGMALSGELPIEAELALTLGKEIRLTLAPSEALPGAIEIEVGGERHVAPLGPCKLPFGDWKLELGDGDWLELDSGSTPAYLNDVELAPRATLLLGDRLSLRRAAPSVLEILG